jgi:hypothetical protein
VEGPAFRSRAPQLEHATCVTSIGAVACIEFAWPQLGHVNLTSANLDIVFFAVGRPPLCGLAADSITTEFSGRPKFTDVPETSKHSRNNRAVKALLIDWGEHLVPERVPRPVAICTLCGSAMSDAARIDSDCGRCAGGDEHCRGRVT